MLKKLGKLQEFKPLTLEETKKLINRISINSHYGRFGTSSLKFEIDENGGFKSVSDFFKDTQKQHDLLKKSNKIIFQDCDSIYVTKGEQE